MLLTLTIYERQINAKNPQQAVGLIRDVIDPVAVRFGMETTASGTDGTQAFRERFGWLIASITGNFLPK
jgi:hypothetical protein